MAFTLPSLETLSRGMRQLVPTLIPGARADFWPNNLVVIIKVVAMATFEALLRARWLYRQIFVSTASADHLDVHGAELGLPRALALAATGTATFVATDAVALPAGTPVVSDAGVFYVATAPATAAAGATFVVALAAKEAGEAGNAPAGMLVRLVAPLAGLDTPGTLEAGAAGGAEPEQDEPYRARLLERLRARPRGGNADDYLFWVRETGVFSAAAIRGWHPSAGRVTIYPLKPGSGSSRLPSLPELEALAEHIETRRPLCAEVVVAQAVAYPVNITIADLAGDNEVLRQEIYAELADLFDERAAVSLPGAQATFYRSWISEAVSRAAGEDHHTLSVPAGNLVVPAGAFPVLGTIGYI